VSIRSLSFAAVILLLVTPRSAPAQAYDSTVFAGLTWREIGIFRGGRSVAVAGSAARPNEYWFGTTGGGVFKSTDGGNTWLPVTDKYFGGTIGAIGVAESNPDIVYVGTGEFPIRGNVSHGDGVWKTTDGGKTWTFLGLAETQQIARVRVHPTNPDIVYVAAQGHAFGPNPERGVYKTTDGGKTWNKVLFRNDSTGAADLILDPTNPNVLYAGLWQAERRPWTLVSGGAGSGLFKSTDAGEHWTELTKNPGLPTGLWGNIGIAVSPAKPARVWALIEADSGGVYRSDDSGSTWKYLNSDHKLRERAWYYSKIMADPKDTNTVWAPQVNLFKSTDGGVTFRHVIDPHGDNHDLWIASNDPNRLIESNDGGPNVSFNGGKTWTDQDVATAQFYHVETTNHFPYRVCGAQQDNSGVCGPSRWRGGIDRGQWYDVSGESGYIQARPDNPDITYGGDNFGIPRPGGPQDGLLPVDQSVARQPRRPRGGGGEVPLPVDGPVAHLATRSPRAVPRCQRPVQDHQRGAELDGGIARSHPSRSRDTRPLGRPDHAGPDDGRVLRHDLRDRRVATGERADLDRLGRRADLCDARRREAVDQRDAQGVRRLHARVDHRGVALRARHRVRGGKPLPARGHGALHLEDHGLRAHLEQDREGPARHGVRARGARGSGAAGAVVRGDGARCVGLL